MNKKHKECLKKAEGGTVSSYLLDEVNFEEILKSITVTKEFSHDLYMHDFFDKDVYLYYNRTAKLLPRIIGGQLIEAHIIEDDALAYIAVENGGVVYVLAFDEITDCPKWMGEDSERTLNMIEIGVHPWTEWEDKEPESEKA